MRPSVTVSYAQTLDGRIATADGKSQWIGGPESLRLAHELRRDHQAVLVGVGTVRKDDPLLTCRLPDGGVNPIRMVLDPRLTIPLESRLLKTLNEASVWIFHQPNPDPLNKKALEHRGVRLIEITGNEQGLDLRMALETMGQLGVESLFVEGGSRVITDFLRQSLVNRLLVVTAPLILGKGIEAVGDLGIRDLEKAIHPQSVHQWALGKDWATELLL